MMKKNSLLLPIICFIAIIFLACRKKETEADYERIMVGLWILKGQKKNCFEFARFSSGKCKPYGYTNVYFENGTWVSTSNCIMFFDSDCNVIKITPFDSDTGVCKGISDTLPYVIKRDKLYRFRHEITFSKKSPIVLDIFNLKKIIKNKNGTIELQIEPENESASQWYYNNNENIKEIGVSNYIKLCRLK